MQSLQGRIEKLEIQMQNLLIEKYKKDLLENETTKPRISKSGWPAKLNGKAIATWRFN